MPPFEESLRSISELAMRQTGATGYVVSEGQEIVDSHGKTAVLSYKLFLHGKTERHIAFGFPDRNTLEAARPRLERVAEILNSIWNASALRADYVAIAERLAEMETRVLDTKIAERARGFLEDRTRPDPIEEIARHVSFVLRPTPARQTIAQLVVQLQKELEARSVASRAKAILQNSHGMSEEAAHRYLQRASRKTRRPLRDVAEGVVEKFVTAGS